MTREVKWRQNVSLFLPHYFVDRIARGVPARAIASVDRASLTPGAPEMRADSNSRPQHADTDPYVPCSWNTLADSKTWDAVFCYDDADSIRQDHRPGTRLAG